MGHSSAIGLLAFALCLVACVSEGVGGTSGQPQDNNVSAESAQEAVDEAKKSITKVNSQAESEVNKAKALLNSVEAFKTTVEEAKRKATEALSQAEKAAQDNAEAKDLLEKIKEISKAVSTSYQNAKDTVEQTIASLDAVLEELKTLKTECDTEENTIKESPPKYADIKTKALEIKKTADKFDENITAALTKMGEEGSIEKAMEKNVQEAQLKSLKVRSITAAAKIDTLIRTAGSITQTKQSNKNQVNEIAQQLQRLKTAAKRKSNDNIKNLCKAAEDELTKATNAVGKAKEAEKEMTKEKEIADAALKNVPQHSEVSEAKKEVDKVEACVEKFKGIVEKLKSELLKAENSVRKAKALKKQIETALSSTTSEPSTQEVNKTGKSDPLIGQGTGVHQEDTTIQPTSKELPDQTNNTADKLKDTLSTGVQNVSTTALTGGKAPAPGANNDSAMTVSVPLLVALIASAALQ